MAEFAGGPKTGHSMKLYYNTGTSGTPTWVEVDEIEDLNVSQLQFSVAELRRRANNFTKNLASLEEPIEVEFRLHHGLGETQFDQIRADHFNRASREWAIMDGDITVNGQEGLRCPFFVAGFPWEQNLQDVSGHDVRLVIAYHSESGTELDPSWYEVGGS